MESQKGPTASNQDKHPLLYTFDTIGQQTGGKWLYTVITGAIFCLCEVSTAICSSEAWLDASPLPRPLPEFAA